MRSDFSNKKQMTTTMNEQEKTSESPAVDPFSKFWADMMAGASAVGMGQAFQPTGQEDSAKQMRRAFLDAWAKSCDEFMHSDHFLDMMKRSMDNSLAFREQMNQFLGQALQTGPVPTREDTDAILLAVRTLDERVMNRLDELSRRVDQLERGTEVNKPVDADHSKKKGA